MFVGRQNELAALTAEANQVRSGSARFVLVTGEVGVGKTALVDTFAERLAVEGFRRLRLSLGQPAGASPWRPWRRLVTDLGTGSGAWPNNDVDATDYVADAVVAAARQAPVVLQIDDVYRADELSVAPLECLASLTPSVPLLMVALLREPPGGQHDLGRPHLRLAVRGLLANDAAELVETVAGVALPDRVVAELTRRCDGNPALLRELAERIDAAHATGQGVQPLILDWPAEVRAAAQHRLAPLPVEARDVLAVASVIGREFDLAVLERLVPEPPIGAIGLALHHGLLLARPHQVYAFTQALVREVLYDSLGVVRRAELHEATAAALAAFRRPVSDRAPTLAEFAHHLVAATVLGGQQRLDTAIAYATAAGNAATTAGAYHDASAYHETAVALAIRADWPPAAAGRLSVALGRSLLAAGATDRGRTALHAVARHARQDGDWALAAQAALAHGPRPTIGLSAADPDLVGQLRPLLDVAELDADLRVRVQARLAIELAGPGTMADAAALADAPQPAALLTGRGYVEAALARAVTGGQPEQGRAAQTAADNLNEPLLRNEIGLVQAGIAYRHGDPMPLEHWAASTDHPLASWWQSGTEAARHTAAGRLVEAEAALVQARLTGRDLPFDVADSTYAAQLALIRLLQGRCLELAPLLAELARFGARLPWLTALSARLAVDQGRPAMARTVLAEALPATDPVVDPYSAVLLAEVAIELGDAAAGKELDRAFGAMSDTWLVQGPALLVLGPPGLWQARLRLARGDAKRAEAAAVAVESTVVDTVWQPWTLVTLAEARAAMSAENAVATAESALAAAERMALGSVAVRARRLTGTLAPTSPAAPTAAPVSPSVAADPEALAAAGLTRREREVLELALSGTSAKDIATSLFISERTAESHLANIYRKLNVRSRVELLARRPN